LTIPGYILAADLRKDRTDMANGLGGGLLVNGKVGIELLTNDNLVSNFTQYCKLQNIDKEHTAQLCFSLSTPQL
jgi:hypothetical protein